MAGGAPGGTQARLNGTPKRCCVVGDRKGMGGGGIRAWGAGQQDPGGRGRAPQGTQGEGPRECRKRTHILTLLNAHTRYRTHCTKRDKEAA